MSIEKIEKLIESPNIDDKKLGLLFLLKQLGEEGLKDYFIQRPPTTDWEWSLVVITPKYNIYPVHSGFRHAITSGNDWGFAGFYKIDLK